MEITEHTRSTISQALRRLKMSKADLAKKMESGRSWSTKLMNGSLKRLSDDQTERLEDILGVSLLNISEKNPTPELAKQLGEQMKKSDDLAEVVAALVRMGDSSLYHSIPHIPTKDLVDFGKEITRAAHEDPSKPGKVGRIAITWLADRLKKLSDPQT